MRSMQLEVLVLAKVIRKFRELCLKLSTSWMVLTLAVTSKFLWPPIDLIPLIQLLHVQVELIERLSSDCLILKVECKSSRSMQKPWPSKKTSDSSSSPDCAPTQLAPISEVFAQKLVCSQLDNEERVFRRRT